MSALSCLTRHRMSDSRCAMAFARPNLPRGTDAAEGGTQLFLEIDSGVVLLLDESLDFLGLELSAGVEEEIGTVWCGAALLPEFESIQDHSCSFVAFLQEVVFSNDRFQSIMI